MIKIGTSGFSFKDWRGPVYPLDLDPKETLCYYQKGLGFNCVEINATYYTLMSTRSFEAMEQKTGEGFEFVVKGYRGITHDPFDNRLHEKRPSMGKALEDLDRFIYSLQPLKEKDKLGGILLQFPVFFFPNAQSTEYLLSCKEKINHNTPLIIEFRNRSWARAKTFEFLKQNHLNYCAVDEPRLPQLMPFIGSVTSDIGYLRLHGRNLNWFKAKREERYNYLYSDEELREFIPEIEKMDREAKKTFVFFNNCHGGLAVKNALTLLDLVANPH